VLADFAGLWGYKVHAASTALFPSHYLPGIVADHFLSMLIVRHCMVVGFHLQGTNPA
jgi:hypothetical protein